MKDHLNGKKILKHILYVIEFMMITLISVVSILLSSSIVWMFQTWNNLTMDELMYQVNAPIEGTNSDIILDYIHTCVPSAIIVIFCVAIICIGLHKNKKNYHIALAILLITSLLSAIYYFHMAWERLDIKNYSESKNTYSSFIDNNYVDPRSVEITFPEQKRNLIYIFLESMETTYSDKASGGAFDKGCIPELTTLAQENEDFSGDDKEINGATPMSGATWTMGAMFAQTSGLPLNIPIQGLNMDTQETFFPDLVTLGDILAGEGYSQTLMIGSDATFAGRKLYFTEHGNYAMKDYYYEIDKGNIPEDYYVWWGYEDKKLFEYAKEELLETANQGQPFNFTMLTVDTHFEDGYLCEDCGDEFGENKYANVMACSSKKVKEFIEWIQQQDFYENTTIVVCGDHLTMDSDFCNEIDSGYDRKVYTAYINSAVVPESIGTRRNYTTFDMFPTTLASLGAEIQGNRLGLGVNLFSNVPTLEEVYGKDEMNAEVAKSSELMEQLNSTIDLNSEELLKREGKLPTAIVNVEQYNSEEGILPVYISEITNVTNEIASINVAVYTEEDKSDLQWVQANLVSEGAYLAEVYVPDFNYKVGGYNIEVYVVDQDGNQTLVGTGQGNVE